MGRDLKAINYAELILANQTTVLPNRAHHKTFVIAEVGHRVVGSIAVHLDDDRLVVNVCGGCYWSIYLFWLSWMFHS
jgi:hypothetical protein